MHILSLENNIDIVIAIVTSINKTLIIDGTKRCLALFYLKAKEEKKLMDILASAYSINIVTLKSSICRILFQVDFCKLRV
jgi:hypothetical protein